MLFYRIVWWTVAKGSGALFRVRLRGQERLPRSGGYVLAPSHRSMMDILLLALVTKERIRYMGKVEVFNIPVLGSIFRALGGFPVARDGTDRKAVRDSMAMLRAGDRLAVFPEGTRQNGPKIHPLQPGAAYLALRADVPIVPVGIAGSEEILRGGSGRLPRFGRVAIVVGEPLDPPPRTTSAVPRAEVEAFTIRLADALQQTFDEALELREQ
ncbi:MAG: lysophospholipid acyltransferase family protein [Acidimicrobiia bacterium]